MDISSTLFLRWILKKIDVLSFFTRCTSKKTGCTQKFVSNIANLPLALGNEVGTPTISGG